MKKLDMEKPAHNKSGFFSLLSHFYSLTSITMSTLTVRSTLSKEIYNFTTKFNRHLSKPHQSNLRELLLGIIISGTTHLSSVGEISANRVTPRKNTERLSNTLSKMDVKQLQQAHILATANKYIEEPVLLLTDGGDIQKTYTKKMELAGITIDGSRGHQVGNGYPTLACVAYGTKSRQIEPLFYSIHSAIAEDYKSDWDEQKKAFNSLTPITRNSTRDRIVVEDRGCDDEKRFLYYTEELEISFLTRIKVGRNSRRVCPVVDGELQKDSISIHELADTLRSQAEALRAYRNKKLKKKLTSRITFQEVRLITKPELPLFLVLVYTDGMLEPLALLTDIAVGSPEKAWDVFFWYQKRWEVENFFRTIKQNFGAEQFLVRSFKKIQGITFLMLLSYSLILKLKSKAKEFFETYLLLFTEFCRKWQRKKESHLDVLQFLRDIFRSNDLDFSYRYFSKKIRFSRRFKPRGQLALFDWREKW